MRLLRQRQRYGGEIDDGSVRTGDKKERVIVPVMGGLSDGLPAMLGCRFQDLVGHV
jgi:hypothetical protein